MSVVGIDFGYQNSVIAAAGRGGVDVILNGNSNRLNPSMIGFDDCRKMGEHALSGVTSNFKNTVKGMKRLVGLAFEDPRAQKEMEWMTGVSFQPVQHPSGNTVGVEIHKGSDQERVVPVEAICGMMIHHMGEIAGAKAAEGSDAAASSVFPQDWVVAIPNYFTDSQRRGLRAGCEIVGITGVQRFMHENTATALSYGIFKDLKKEFVKDQSTHVMFIDMGASAYTVSIVDFQPGQLNVKAAYCDANLGGRDFDFLIANWLADGFQAKFGAKLSGKPMDKPKSRIKLLAAAEKAKKTLSPAGVKEARVNLEMLMDDLDHNASLKATEYEAMCQPLLARLAGPIQKALAEAKLTAADLSSVEIVGGSSRIGCVKQKLLEALPGVDTLSTTMNADEAVARGAALQSAILSPRFKVLPYDIQEAQPYPIQISWPPSPGEETSSVVMFDRGLSFPIVRRVTLKRAGNFEVKARYDDSAAAYGLETPNAEIATFQIQNESAEEVKVRVNIKEDIHGIAVLSSAQKVEEVEAEPEATEEKAAAEGEEAAKEGEAAEPKKKIKKTNLECTTTRPLEWTKPVIQKYNELEVAMANHDRIIRETADMRNELESYIYDMRDKISSDNQLGPYGTSEEKEAFNKANSDMENWLYEDGFDASKSVYSTKLQELKALGRPLEKRQSEAQNRPTAVSSLQTNVESYTNWVNESQQDEEKYGHITDEEREKVRAKADEVSGWLYEQLDKQGGLGLDQDPVLTVHTIQMKHKELTDTCSPIIYKPKPKPKPKEEPKKEEEAKKDEEPKKEDPMEGVEVEANGEKMETD